MNRVFIVFFMVNYTKIAAHDSNLKRLLLWFLFGWC